MNRWWSFAVAGVLAWGWLSAPFASAQGTFGGVNPGQPGPQPPFSPYLNLNRFGTNPATNYYGLVRPQLTTQQQLQLLQQNQLAGRTGTGALTQDQAVPLATTGHPVFYNDYSRYFPLQGYPGAGSGPGVGYGNARPGGFPGTGIGAGLGTGATPGIGVGPGTVGATPGFGIVVPR